MDFASKAKFGLAWAHAVSPEGAEESSPRRNHDSRVNTKKTQPPKPKETQLPNRETQ